MALVLFIALCMSTVILAFAIVLAVFTRDYGKKHPEKKIVAVLLWTFCVILFLFFLGGLGFAGAVFHAIRSIFP